MNEIDYGALFGIDEGGKEQETAEPARVEEAAYRSASAGATKAAPDATSSPFQNANADAGLRSVGRTTSAQGGEAQEIAAPAEEDQDETQQETGADDQVSEEDAGGEQPESNTETDSEGARDANARNAQFAAARRKAEAERDAAIAKAREDARAEAQRFIDEAFASSGMTNPYTKKPITSKAEYEEYRERFEEEKKSHLLRKSGMSDEEFNQFVQNLPEVREAREAKLAAEKARQDAQEAQAKVQVDEQLKKISELDPNIRELQDLAKMPNYPQFYELVKKGNSLLDAFKLANFETLSQGTAARARQAAINAAQSKQHLAQTQTRGKGAVPVPSDVKELYRTMNPGVTDAEIQAHYSRTHKG